MAIINNNLFLEQNATIGFYRGMTQTIDSKKYNGWTNYETWLVKLWIDNDEGSQNYWIERAQEAFGQAEADDTFSKSERAALDLRNELKNWHEEIIDETTKPTGFVADLLNAAMSEVNWYEIAESLIEDNVETETAKEA